MIMVENAEERRSLTINVEKCENKTKELGYLYGRFATFDSNFWADY